MYTGVPQADFFSEPRSCGQDFMTSLGQYAQEGEAGLRSFVQAPKRKQNAALSCILTLKSLLGKARWIMGHETWILVSILSVQLTAYPNSRVIPGAIQTLTFSGCKVE